MARVKLLQHKHAITRTTTTNVCLGTSASHTNTHSLVTKYSLLYGGSRGEKVYLLMDPFVTMSV